MKKLLTEFNKINLNPNSREVRALKASLSHLSPVLMEIAIGIALGDGSIQTQNGGETYRMKFEWGDINKDYAHHVHSVFSDWILSEPREQIRINKYGNEVKTWAFQTFSHEAFNPLADLFINSEGKKEYPLI